MTKTYYQIVHHMGGNLVSRPATDRYATAAEAVKVAGDTGALRVERVDVREVWSAARALAPIKD